MKSNVRPSASLDRVKMSMSAQYLFMGSALLSFGITVNPKRLCFSDSI